MMNGQTQILLFQFVLSKSKMGFCSFP